MRGVDSATLSEINPASAVSEDLVLASTDKNVDVLRHWFKQMRKLGAEQPMLGWVLVEADAYRQIAVDPWHRKYSGIAMKTPGLGR